MANCIAIARARGNDGARVKETRRLGSKTAEAEANTWRTCATIITHNDGSGYFELWRDGKLIHAYDWRAEDSLPS